MTNLYGDNLIRLGGPVVLWESQEYRPLPSSGAGHDFGLAIGNNRGMFGAYVRVKESAAGYGQGDVIQLHPDFVEPVGSPGGQIALRVNPSRLTSRVLQGIYTANRITGASGSIDGDARYALQYRGLFSAGRGPYPQLRSHTYYDGPLMAGETPEFSFSASGVEVGNPSAVHPFMWTLFGRCLVADGACAPGDVMAFGSNKQAGTVRGWNTSYSETTSKFSISAYSSVHPWLVGKDGAPFIPTVANWSFFFRFVGTPKSGLLARAPKRAQSSPLNLWMSPPVPMAAGLKPISFATPEGFSPHLVNSYFICNTAEHGFSVGDWLPAQEGNNNASDGGLSATFDSRNVTLSPQSSQAHHRLDTGAIAAMTPAFWSWFFVFVG